LYTAADSGLLEAINAFLTDHPDDVRRERVSLMKAEVLFGLKDFAAAAQIYQYIIQSGRSLTPTYRAEALYKLGWCQIQLQAPDKALGPLGQLLKDHPDSPNVPAGLAQRGAAQMQLRQFSAAERDFDEIIRRFPNSNELEFSLESKALIRGQLGDSLGMAEAFEKMLRAFPKSAAAAKANYWIGRGAFDAKAYTKAAKFLDQARKLDREQFYERASLPIMLCYYNLENMEALIAEIDSYQQSNGKADIPTDILRWVGTESHKKGQYANVERFIPPIILRKEAVAGDFLVLARSRSATGKYKEAVESFGSYLAEARDPAPRATGLIERAEAEMRRMNWAAADKDVEEALILQPEGRIHGKARLMKGAILEGRGMLDEAVKAFEAIFLTLDDEEVSPEALDRAITIRRSQGRTSEANRLDNQLRSRYPEYKRTSSKAAP
jgi:TolA-binding protein